MARDEIGRILQQAHGGRYLVRIRAVNPSGNTVDIVGYVTAIKDDGDIKVCEGDPEHGLIHEFPARSILGVARVHGA